MYLAAHTCPCLKHITHHASRVLGLGLQVCKATAEKVTAKRLSIAKDFLQQAEAILAAWSSEEPRQDFEDFINQQKCFVAAVQQPADAEPEASQSIPPIHIKSARELEVAKAHITSVAKHLAEWEAAPPGSYQRESRLKIFSGGVRQLLNTWTNAQRMCCWLMSVDIRAVASFHAQDLLQVGAGAHGLDDDMLISLLCSFVHTHVFLSVLQGFTRLSCRASLTLGIHAWIRPSSWLTRYRRPIEKSWRPPKC